jgi:hypothetical protein
MFDVPKVSFVELRFCLQGFFQARLGPDASFLMASPCYEQRRFESG